MCNASLIKVTGTNASKYLLHVIINSFYFRTLLTKNVTEVSMDLQIVFTIILALNIPCKRL